MMIDLENDKTLYYLLKQGYINDVEYIRDKSGKIKYYAHINDAMGEKVI